LGTSGPLPCSQRVPLLFGLIYTWEGAGDPQVCLFVLWRVQAPFLRRYSGADRVGIRTHVLNSPVSS
jgi:hypothetical protein